MKKSYFLSTLLAGLVMIGVTGKASAALINFVATGNANVTGYIQIDDADVNGTVNQQLSNSLITDLSLVVSGFTFSLADVITSDFTIIDSSIATGLRIDNGSGTLANDGSRSIFLNPGSDGDASIVLTDPFASLDPLWIPQAVVPIPPTLWLFGSGILGLISVARRKKS